MRRDAAMLCETGSPNFNPIIRLGFEKRKPEISFLFSGLMIQLVTDRHGRRPAG